MKMNTEAKKLWLEALRSGEYEQVTNVLRRDGGYCCLGVLCEVAIKAGVDVQHTLNDNGEHFYGVDRFLLPPLVQSWAGLTHGDGAAIGFRGQQETLVSLNDVYGQTFDEIADVVEAQL